MSTFEVKSYLTQGANEPFLPTPIPRRAVGPNDVSIQIKYCGICHSDLSFYKNEWGITKYPLVPGHEIVGVVDAVGENVKRFKLGARVGVGCIVNSCRSCKNCGKGEENYCEEGFTGTYGFEDKRSGEIQYGGYSEKIVVDEHFVLSVPENLDFAAAAPLLCAGITTFTPLAEADIKEGSKVGIIGIGGLGHVGIKLARALGAEVYAFTRSEDKVESLKALGATDVIVTSKPENFLPHQGKLDLVIDTISDAHDVLPYLSTIRFRGTFALVGAGAEIKLTPMLLLFKGLNIRGSAVGGIAGTQKMLDLCGKHNITADIELAHLKDLSTLYERLAKGDVRYRFVLDIENDFKSL